MGCYPPQQLPALLATISGPDVPFGEQRAELRRWLEHWTAKGRAVEALAAIEGKLDTMTSGLVIDEALDPAFRISLAAEGKDAALRWLVRAHISRYGWASYMVSEKETMARLQNAAIHYPERWLEFVRETSAQSPYWARRGRGLVIGQKYLVRFLLLVGEVERASAVTDALVSSLVQEVQDQPVSRASRLS